MTSRNQTNLEGRSEEKKRIEEMEGEEGRSRKSGGSKVNLPTQDAGMVDATTTAGGEDRDADGIVVTRRMESIKGSDLQRRGNVIYLRLVCLLLTPSSS